MTKTEVDVEYCGVCNLKLQCEKLAEIIQIMCPEANVNCRRGRYGSFEVTINDKLVHSKLQTLALPDFKSVADTVKDAQAGKTIPEKVKEQKINDCIIM